MELAQLSVEIRQGSGKSDARRLRRENRLPGIVYGAGEESIKVQVDPTEIRAAVSAHEGSLPIFSIVGVKEAEKLTGKVVLVRELQTDPLTHEYLHVDLMNVDLSKKITVEVPLHFVGVAPGTKEGGIIEEPVRKLDITCLPSEIPEHIEIDTSELNIGDSIHIEDVQLPEGCSVDTSVNFTVVSVVAPKRVVEEVEEEGAALEEEGQEPGEEQDQAQEQEGETAE